MAPESSRFSDRVVSLFDDFLRRRDAGQNPDFDDLCRANASVADELRSLHDAFAVLSRLWTGSVGALAFAESLRARYGDGADPAVTLEGRDSSSEPPSSAFLERLRAEGPRGTRYEPMGEVGRGGMGVVLSVWDGLLRRRLAMKVARPQQGGRPRDLDAQTLGRFLEEAQITAQLDHPGIVPVHDMGLGDDGRVYFTMRLVRGVNLGEVFERARSREEGWNELRALDVVLKVCDAMSYAHDKGVIHRDLKPANVMVGRYGEAYVMDWGLARVLGQADRHDLRLEAPRDTDSVHTMRDDDGADSPLVTLDGVIVGTPSYMSPEQASGRLEAVGRHSDVYSVGAMVYQLLSGEMPYVKRGTRISSHTVLARLLDGPPVPLDELAPLAPAELVAICEKAMAREIGERYATMAELAADLRAFLEGRVVRAYEVGPWAEARKWVKRNKALAAVASALVLSLAGGSVAVSMQASRAVDAAEVATARTNEVLSLSARRDFDELMREAAELWPATPEMIPRFAAWMESARALVDGRAADPARNLPARPSLADHKASLARLALRARPSDSHATSPASLDFDDSADAWWHDALRALIEDIERIDNAQTGLAGNGWVPEFGWGMGKRLEFAKTIQDRSRSSPAAAALWADAIARIEATPKYGGLRLAPQLGLLPIGPDPESGLWEFADLASGSIPTRGADGSLLCEDDACVIFVLVPASDFWMGADPKAGAQNFDPEAAVDEGPVRKVSLSPFLISKHELTQAQWTGLSGSNPSAFGPDRYATFWNSQGLGWSGRHPVENVSWREFVSVLARVGMTLPTEAQWECACRAGTTTPFSSGMNKDSLQGSVNLSDAFGRAHGNEFPTVETWLDDGNTVHAPVGSYRPNALGLYDMHGNVSELVLDQPSQEFWSQYDGGIDPVGKQPASSDRVMRGGNCYSSAMEARSSAHGAVFEGQAALVLGCRPARTLTR